MKSFKISEIENKSILGRTVPIEKNKPLVCFWAASGLELTVKSSEVYILISSNYDRNEPWISIYINGRPISRFMVEKEEKKWVCIAKNMNMENENTITIYKDTQAMPDDSLHSLFIYEVKISEGGTFCPPKQKDMKIEFVGDSITSGEGLAGGPNDWDWIPQLFVGSLTYASQTARMLNAEYSVISQSGWGICWGWDGNRYSRLPPYYEQVCGVSKSDYQKSIGSQEAYDFKGGADYVVVNLGTNDNGAFYQPPWRESEFGEKYKLSLNSDGTVCEKDSNYIIKSVKDFLRVIRKNNPKALIIWCWGMCKLELVPPLIQYGVEEYMFESGDKKVYTLELDSMDDVEKTDEEKGSRAHPGYKTHKLAANKLCDFIKNPC